MSTLQVYTPYEEFSYMNFYAIGIAIALLFVQVKVYTMFTDEVNRLKSIVESRIDSLEDVMKKRFTPLEEVAKNLLAAQEDMETELWEIDTALKGHGEEIALTAVATYEGYVITNAAACPSPMDDYINEYLRDSGSATVSEIFKHLNKNTPLAEMWPKLYGEKAPKMAPQHLYRRLYALLYQGKLKIDSSEGPIVWSL